MGSSHGKQVLTGKNTAVLKSDQGPNRIGAAARSLERPREKGGVTRRCTKGTCLGTPGRGVYAAGPVAGEAVRAEAGAGPRGRGGRRQASQTQPVPLGKGTGKAQAGTGDQGRGCCAA